MKNKHLYEEQLIDYILGNLSSDEHFFVTRHVKRCRKCAQTLNMWQNLLSEETIRVPSTRIKKQLMKKTNSFALEKIPRFAFIFTFIGLLFFSVSYIGKISKDETVVKNEEALQVVQEDLLSNQLGIQQLHITTLNSETISKQNHKKDIPVFSKNEVPNHYINQLVFFQNGPLCAYDKYEKEIVCYTFDPITNKFYPIFKLK